jgi:uncharacterized protein with HEPN domain
MNRNDEIRLRHMLEAGKEALSFSANKTRTDLDSDRMLVLSLVKSIEIIGEAASKASTECRRVFSDIPWQDIVGMRNRLIHAYFQINLDILWITIREDLPLLVRQLEGILG